MNPLKCFLTKALTNKVMGKAAADGMAENESNRVEQVQFLRWLFRGLLLFGLVLAALAFSFHEPIVALLFLALSGSLSVPMLISYHTCWITYGDTGFTESTFPGIKHRYSYEDVTGLADSGASVEIEVCGKKRIV